MVLRELLGLIDLLGAQTLYIHKTMEFILVCKDKNLILIAFQVVAPYFEGFDNSQKLNVVGLVLYFC